MQNISFFFVETNLSSSQGFPNEKKIHDYYLHNYSVIELFVIKKKIPCLNTYYIYSHTLPVYYKKNTLQAVFFNKLSTYIYIYMCETLGPKKTS